MQLITIELRHLSELIRNIGSLVVGAGSSRSFDPGTIKRFGLAVLW